MRQRLDIVLERAVDNAGFGGMHGRAAEGLVGDFLIGDGFDDVRAGDIHVGRVLHHEDEVCQGGRIDVAAGARAHDDRDLRDHAGGEDVFHEDVGITGERINALLDARAAGIEDADNRRAVLHGHLLDLDDLVGMGAAEAAAEDGEILGEDVDEAAIDGALAGDDAVTGDFLVLHAEIGATMFHEHVEFFETVLVEQDGHAFAGGQFALFVLFLDPSGAATLTGCFAACFQSFDNVLHSGPLPAINLRQRLINGPSAMASVAMGDGAAAMAGRRARKRPRSGDRGPCRRCRISGRDGRNGRGHDHSGHSGSRGGLPRGCLRY